MKRHTLPPVLQHRRPVCPHCGGSGVEPSGIDLLKRKCRERQIAILSADRVREGGAALLVNRAPETLRSWRNTDQRLPFQRDAAGRISYPLATIAAFLNLGDENR